MHPAVVAFDIWRPVPWPARPLIKLRMLSPEQGAATSLRCATAPEVSADGGRYYEACGVRGLRRAATAELARAFWERSQAWTAS